MHYSAIFNKALNNISHCDKYGEIGWDDSEVGWIYKLRATIPKG